MKLYQVVAKDALRRRRRLLYTALGVVVGVAVFISVLTIAEAGEAKIYKELDKYGANLMVTPAVQDVGLNLGTLELGNLSVGENYVEQSKLPSVRQITDDAIREALGSKLNVPEGDPIASIAPHLYVNTKIGNASIVAVGFDPAVELFIKTWWEVNGKFPEQPNEAIIGQTAAELLKLQVGDTVTLEGEPMTLVGILTETGSSDDFQIFLPLATAQRLFKKEGYLSSIDVRALCNGCPVEVIADEINKAIPGVRAVAIKQIANNEMNLISKMNDFLLTLAGITLLIGAFGVVNTMMSSVHERIKDIGIMKAVGASRNQVLKMFLYEALIIGIIGGFVGYVAGTLLSYAIGPLIFDGVEITYVMGYLPAALGVAMVVAVVSSLYPAFRASQIKVSDSIRSM